jgi:hypothetical protein
MSRLGAIEHLGCQVLGVAIGGFDNLTTWLARRDVDNDYDIALLIVAAARV